MRDWRLEIADALKESERAADDDRDAVARGRESLTVWFGREVAPAIEEVAEELRKNGCEAREHFGGAEPMCMGLKVTSAEKKKTILDLSIVGRATEDVTDVVIEERFPSEGRLSRSQAGFGKPFHRVVKEDVIGMLVTRFRNNLAVT